MASSQQSVWDVNRALDSLFTHNVTGHAQQKNGIKPTICLDQTVGKPGSSLAGDSTSASSTSSPRLSGLLLTPEHGPSLVTAVGAPAMAAVPLLPPGLDPSTGNVLSTAGNIATPPKQNGAALPVSVVPKRRLAK